MNILLFTFGFRNIPGGFLRRTNNSIATDLSKKRTDPDVLLVQSPCEKRVPTNTTGWKITILNTGDTSSNDLNGYFSIDILVFGGVSQQMQQSNPLLRYTP